MALSPKMNSVEFWLSESEQAEFDRLIRQYSLLELKVVLLLNCRLELEIKNVGLFTTWCFLGSK